MFLSKIEQFYVRDLNINRMLMKKYRLNNSVFLLEEELKYLFKYQEEVYEGADFVYVDV
jgi:hypothetical protein